MPNGIHTHVSTVYRVSAVELTFEQRHKTTPTGDGALTIVLT